MQNESGNPFLAQMPDVVFEMGSRITVPPQAYIIKTNALVPTFYLFEQGSAKLVHETADATTIILDIYHQGDFCGEIELMGLTLENRSVIALNQCELLRYTKEQFFTLWDTCGEFSRWVLHVHCERLLKAGDDKVYLDGAMLRQRVFRIIQNNINARNYFVYTKQILAELAGISMRSLNRTLSELQQDRLIMVDSGTIRLFVD
jgi:CRP-like cAMP-binding protein